jgi:hypothetical protein
VWAQSSTRGAGVTVAIIDTGIDYNHPILGGGFGSGFKVAGGWDFFDDDADPMDESAHGTLVAGIVAGEGNGLVGVAPDATLLAYRALGPQGGSASQVIAAIERCVDPNDDGDPSDHVDIVNMSLGGVAIEDDPLAAAVESATAAGVLFCIAANNNYRFGTLTTPAIAASRLPSAPRTTRTRIADFSSRGPAYDFGIKPEVVAPCVKIVSTPNGNYVEAQGTSMARRIAGVAALVRPCIPTGRPHGSSPRSSRRRFRSKATSWRAARTHRRGERDDGDGAPVSTVVSFGQIDAARRMDRVATVTLRNMSAATQTLTASVHGLREGVSVSVTPPVVVLDAGATADGEDRRRGDEYRGPAPTEGSLSFGGRIAWAGAVPVHVPWAFVKGAFLTIVVPDARNEVLGESSARGHRCRRISSPSRRACIGRSKKSISFSTSRRHRQRTGSIASSWRADRYVRTPRPPFPSRPRSSGLHKRRTKREATSSAGRECLDFVVFAFRRGGSTRASRRRITGRSSVRSRIG